MKRFATSVAILTLTVVTTFAQSTSYQALREKFRGEQNVVAMHTSGSLARAILWFAGEHDFREAIEDVKDIRFIVIPKKAFRSNDVSVAGFKKIASKDSFEEIARVKDHGDDVTLMMQTSYKEKHNRYLVVVENDDEVVVMEIKGYIDPTLAIYKEKIAYN